MSKVDAWTEIGKFDDSQIYRTYLYSLGIGWDGGQLLIFSWQQSPEVGYDPGWEDDRPAVMLPPES